MYCLPLIDNEMEGIYYTMQRFKHKKRTLLQCIVLVISALMIAYGVNRGELETVWNKAVNICLECIGLG